MFYPCKKKIETVTEIIFKHPKNQNNTNYQITFERLRETIKNREKKKQWLLLK
jgi:hypothetical protein